VRLAPPELSEVLALFGLKQQSIPTFVPDSVSNDNYRVETDRGPVFVKAYVARRTVERVQREHDAIAWVAEHGRLPVNPPLLTPSGESVVEVGGGLWALFPWLEGATFQRHSLTADEAGLLGGVFAQTHAALATHPLETLPRNSELTWDTATSLAEIDSLEPHVRQRGTDVELAALLRQRSALLAGPTIPCSEFADLPESATHGDFHERNVILDPGGSVAAVVDWERFCRQPPAFELLRALSFMLVLDGPPLTAFLQGYGRVRSLERSTIRPCIEAWHQSALHITWAFRDAFLAGNEATRQFIPEDDMRSARFADDGFRASLEAMILRYAC
jgi:Ser/Thr protein kinase RdoA (MazF antagonist)